MSNEYKDWLIDKAYDIIFEHHLMDRVNTVYHNDFPTKKLLVGELDNKPVAYHVWLDDNGIWHYKMAQINI